MSRFKVLIVFVLLSGFLWGCSEATIPKEDWEIVKSQIEIYEDYYGYYCQMISAMEEKNEKEFTENCVALYYYIGNSSDKLTKEEYKGWSEKEIKEDLKTIVHQLVENFGNDKVIKMCMDYGVQIEYKSEVLEAAMEYVEYKPTEEELDWGEDLFIEYIMQVINE